MPDSPRSRRSHDQAPDPPRAAMAAAVAGALSGIPSTVHALATGRPPLAAARAAGALLGRPSLPRGLAAHVGVSLLWAGVLAAALPRRRPLTSGALAGLGIAALDLGVVGRHVEEIRSLPLIPQVLDHVAFGVAAAIVLDHREPIAPQPSPTRRRNSS